ncbi:tRNA (adenosine(37)-N6)-threonylcarbamoyltransferase complex dimerization subunit type 1 TsaB [Alicyclobacillus fastidiosus]|uniref:tRNA (Adenosine(37)-N6)-threonylcarbamoyltransferase complex dimerization subunit type 1 TsaB n=1 Tax=Alicyclobacillus fastidiosus TaxID=392011 RepID=A0ABY6ZFI3_9BACL|nr:tRNA (adenosine(37)-N6)-threonylcarbamoyltransferase complex dimerization subunit type 1 TsaB [Alicyclobacillus fastidiosus]WAH41663.1 tRNA (adenosine(37)-N6)-threonylcarbamoyltransferase complex dimerization subunit type 1 TsaB [Alicyclobacillus fastidiosus]GMA63341.1 tRNA (adenosine(37)-N6)-threonylcarbamoyltransferase complex dimerization subunit type 1 TsaB [Alicyclobacillus fastidiosus]
MGVIVMDTATDALGVAAGRMDGTLLSAVTQRVPRGHSRLLQPSVQFVMKSAGFSAGDIVRIGVGTGPGSYTGVRMAVSTGKAMAHALRVPLVTVPTLDAIALAAGMGAVPPAGADQSAAKQAVLVLLFARRHRAFGGWFALANGQLCQRSQAEVKPIEAWLNEVPGGKACGIPLLVHDLPQAELEPHCSRHAFQFATWSDVCTRFSDALFRLSLKDDYPVFEGERIHTVLPDYALPVEAEAKLQSQREGGARP